jgi:tRNA (adenine57-N1/adenine58-N1)-methyltransferase catalytic subunit
LQFIEKFKQGCKLANMFETKKIIEENDFVIFFISPESLSTVQVTRDNVINNRLGHFRLEKAIGRPFGYLLTSECGKRKVALLRPTPELWTRSLPHRTQILYSADISLIIQFLRIQEGSRVIESGTGSGSMTHALSKAVGPSGKVFTFEYHPGRAEQARQEFSSHKLDNVVLTHMDVCKQGFTEGLQADSVFLDLPEPWTAIPFLKKSIRDSRGIVRICCFSPCIEQVQKTCKELRQNGWSDIEMYETLLRNVEVFDTNFSKKRRPDDEKPHDKELVSKFSTAARGHTSYLAFASFIN